MSKLPIRTPEIPVGLEPYADEQFYRAHGILSDETIGGVKTRMGKTGQFGSLAEDFVVGVEQRPKDENDEKHAILVAYPFANDHQPHMQLRLDMAQLSQVEPQRIIGFPNNAVGNHSYDVENIDLSEVSEGDFTPLARLVGEATHRQGIQRVDIAGYSEGASLFAALIKANKQYGYFDIRSAMLGEPPNVVNRKRRHLMSDFTKTGTAPFEKAVRDSAIDSLEDAQAIKYLMQKPRQILGLGKFGLSLTLPENWAIFGGMTHDTFARDLASANGAGKGLIARAEKSLITPRDANFPENYETFEVEGYGHEAADNIGVFALLVKKAIEKQPSLV